MMSLEKMFEDAGFKKCDTKETFGILILMDEGYYMPVEFAVNCVPGEKAILNISLKGNRNQLEEVKRRVEAQLRRIEDNMESPVVGEYLRMEKTNG